MKRIPLSARVVSVGNLDSVDGNCAPFAHRVHSKFVKSGLDPNVSVGEHEKLGAL
jgi:hypothetical protein